jgi:hypothetical protein
LDTAPPADIIEIIERLHFQRLVAERAFHALATPRRDGDHLVGGKIALGKNVEHLAPNIAGGTHHGDFVTHC